MALRKLFDLGPVPILCAVFVLGVCGPAGAQTPSGSLAGVSECSRLVKAGESQETLKKRKAALLLDLKRKRKELGVIGKAAAERRAKLKREIEAIGGEVAELILKADCFRKRRPVIAYRRAPETRAADAAEKSKEAAARKKLVEIPVYYATNRDRTGKTGAANFYGTRHTSDLEYGRLTVSVPPSHILGELELPSLWKLEFSNNPAKHFAITDMKTYSASEAAAALQTAISSAKSKSLFVFVHGYNTTFTDAALRTAQLANDLKFPGTAMFYSWPSAGSARAYARDRETAELARLVLDKLLDDVAKLPVSEVYILAHSMGNIVVTDALMKRVTAGKNMSRIKEILLAAPDLNAETFRSEIAPALAKMTKTRKTIYASSNDAALKASAHINGYSRVGDTSGGVVIYPGFDTIDASNASSMQREWGHSYVFDSTPVITDVLDVVLAHKSLGERQLQQQGASPNIYWRLQ